MKKRHEEGGETKTIIKGDFIYGWSLINFNERQSCYQYDLEFCQNCVNYKVRKFYLSLGSKYKKTVHFFATLIPSYCKLKVNICKKVRPPVNNEWEAWRQSYLLQAHRYLSKLGGDK